MSVGYVLVPVVARTKAGYADRLDLADFKVTVDGETVPIESFDHGASAPVTLLILQDLSGSIANAGKLSLSRFAIERLLVKTLPGDQWALASFANGRVGVDVPFTNNVDELLMATGKWHPSGVTALHDAVYELPTLSRGVQSARRAAVLITDGADNASEIGPKEARQAIREAELPVYVLGLSTGSPEDLDTSGKKLHRYADVLNLLAHQSGGKYFWISSPNDLVRACGSISSDLRHQYVLGFPTADTGELRYREIEVSTAKKKVALTFRKGYLGRAPRVATRPSM
jgi:Ca-activated chloride channel family protein